MSNYVIAQPHGVQKPRLYKTKSNGGKLIGVIPDSTMWNGDTVDIKSSEIIVTLGENPVCGSVYGVWVEPIRKRLAAKGFGEIYVYADMTDQVQERVLKAFSAALSRVRKLGPQCDWEFNTEVRNPRGNKGGTYRYKSNGVDTLTFYPQDGQGTREMVKVISHELPHGVWYRYMTAEDRAMWIDAYTRFVLVKEVSPKEVRLMVRDMRQIGSVKDYVKNASPDEQAGADIFLGWLKKVHTISKMELQDLLTAGVEVPSPTNILNRSEIQPPITVYAKSSPTEFFAEALCSKAVDDLADKQVDRLLGKLRG